MTKIILVTILLMFFLRKGETKPQIRNERAALPQEIFRESVEPAKGGKVPEAAHMRVELNKIDSAGLDDGDAIRMEQEMSNQSPELPDQAPRELLIDSRDKYNPGRTPPLKLKPDYHPPKQTYDPEPAFVPEPVYVPQSVPAFNLQPKPTYVTKPAYVPVTEPAYIPPVGPVLLENRPYKVKSVQSLPISVTDTVTTFDCRTKPYLGRHYADSETGCQIYHYCHDDGKQDTFTCSEGTIFNEYLGTCDYTNSVHCNSGDGYIPKPVYTPAPYQPKPAYKPAPYQPNQVYKKPAPSYIRPTPAYHQPAPSYKKPTPVFHQPVQTYNEPSLPYQKPSLSFHKPEPFTNFGKK